MYPPPPLGLQKTDTSAVPHAPSQKNRPSDIILHSARSTNQGIDDPAFFPPANQIVLPSPSLSTDEQFDTSQLLASYSQCSILQPNFDISNNSSSSDRASFHCSEGGLLSFLNLYERPSHKTSQVIFSDSITVPPDGSDYCRMILCLTLYA
ncbi:unnamed protein product [Protopolystoma xenopodis]|uniref:Uncharacterized protein n=1 Tax=Protopolystoma xenopodis TaxID=117903 RepID=A0A448WL09_9PLAT|nr:unnamed protein product [Protopolystoma xenopodis]